MEEKEIIYIKKETIINLIVLANSLFLMSYYFGAFSELTNSFDRLVAYFEVYVLVFGSALIYLQFKIWFKRYL